MRPRFGVLEYRSNESIRHCSRGLAHLFDGCGQGLILFPDVIQGLGLNLGRLFLQSVLPLEKLFSRGGIEGIYEEIKVILGKVSNLFSCLFQFRFL